MGSASFDQSLRQLARVDTRLMLQNGVLGGVFARACEVRMAQFLRGIKYVVPVNL
jgi:hypothetical protein